MTKRFGLPTYPIQERMEVGERAEDEIEWLCQHGWLFDVVIGPYLKITWRDGAYVLLAGSHELHLRHHGEETVASAETFAQLLKHKRLKNVRIARWQWFPREEEE